MDTRVVVCFFLLSLFSSRGLGFEDEDNDCVDDSPKDVTPEQVHISFGDSPWDIVATWSTKKKAKGAEVQFTTSNKTQIAGAQSIKFKSQYKKKSSSQYIHWATMSGLIPGANYTYVVGSKCGWSQNFHFRAPPADQTSWSPTLAVYGDLGYKNARSLPFLKKEVASGIYDAVLHLGDFAYDLESDGGQRGNKFMNQIQPIAAAIPYMTAPGNHEEDKNFTEYKNRFRMPGGDQGSLFYSFNLGPLHIISISTEVYYFTANGLKLLVKQYDFLEKDLLEATKPENRRLRPWIIVFGHRPMYCSNKSRRDCNEWTTRTRIGIPILQMFALEPLFFQSGVDLMLWGHEHSYERHWPMYNYTIMNGSLEHPYTDPGAPVQITSGSAGCWEKIKPFREARPPWSAFRSTDYGYMQMKAYNHTHLHLQQFSVEQEKVIDSIWIVKNEHPASFETTSFSEERTYNDFEGSQGDKEGN